MPCVPKICERSCNCTFSSCVLEEKNDIMGSSYSSLSSKILLLLLLAFEISIGSFTLGHAQHVESENVETLDAIQVPGTAVMREKRTLTFPEPDITNLSSFPNERQWQIPLELSIAREFNLLAVSIDETAKIRGIRSSVKPVKTERPPYPQFAREQGWEGTVVLRLVINREGSVSSAKPRESSGYPLLDESAVQSVEQWTFLPAKNGEFPITAIVDLPIRFDLDQ